jgi:hypothetical protein
MEQKRQYRRVHTNHIRLVLKTKPGEPIKWPTSLTGADLAAHRRQIKDAAKIHKLEGSKLLNKIKFTKTITAKSSLGK